MDLISSLPTRRRFGCALAAACLLAVTVLLSSAHAAAAAAYANFNRASYAFSTTLSTSQEANRYQIMVLQADYASEVPLLKAANPNLKILLYQASFSVENTTWAYNSCMTGPWLYANHPNWILHDQNGNPILLANNAYLTDPGNTAYQQTCVANAIATAQADGFDGVFWDMLDAHLGWVLPSGTSVPEYPTDSAWQSAMYSLISYLGPQLHGNGLLAIGNIGGGANYPGLWQTWNGPLDGAEEEGWMMPGQNSTLLTGIWAWPKNLADVAWSEANGKIALIHSWITTEAGNTYGLASMMLVAGGESSYSTSNGCYSTCETWYPEYTTAQQLGAPLGAYTQLSNGVYERRFQNGLVLVNPTANTIASFSLGGGTYTGSQLTSVSSVSMTPTSGYILVADPPTSPPVNVAVPAIAGNAAQGQTLGVTTGTWSGSPGPSYSYQWNRCATTSQSSCAPILGATAANYTVGPSDAGYYLDATVTATNSAGVAAASSAETSLVAVPTFSISASPGSASVARAHSTSFVISVADLNGFTGPVSLSASGLPSGITASFSPLSTTSESTLTLSAAPVAALGTSRLAVIATASGQTKSVMVALIVTQPSSARPKRAHSAGSKHHRHRRRRRRGRRGAHRG